MAPASSSSFSRRLDVLRRRTTLAGVLLALLLAVAVVAALWALAAGVEAAVWLPSGGRLALLGLVLAAGLGVLAWVGGRALLRGLGVLPGLSDELLARRVGQATPQVEDRLVNLLQLSAGRASAAPAPLVASAVARLEHDLQGVPIEHVERFDAPRRALRYAWVPVALLAVFWLAAPSTFSSASTRLLAPTEVFLRPAPFALAVTPGNAAVVRGDTLVVGIEATGRALPARLTLEVRRTGEDATDAFTLQPDDRGRYMHTLVNVRQAFEYRVVAAPVETPWYRVTVGEPPTVRGLQLTLTPPRYTGLPRQVLPAGVGDVTALPGTRVDVTATVSGDALRRVLLDFGGRQMELETDGGEAQGAFVVGGAASYRVLAENADGLFNPNPVAYTVTPLRDEPPAITLEYPQADVELDDSLQTPLRYRFTDDFGFSRLALVYRLVERRYGPAPDTSRLVTLPLDAPRALDQAAGFDWRLRATGLDLLPGDVVEYHVQVWDNDAVAGYKTARTATHRLLLKSLAEQFDALDETQDEAETALEDLMQQSDNVREQFDKLRDELRRQQESDWEDNRQLDALKSQQESMSEQVDKLGETLEEVTESLRDNSLVSEETLEQYRQLQQVMEEIQAPELREALDALREALENLDLEKMEGAFEQFQFNEEQYKERLERALELFKNLRIQQELEEIAERAETLAEQQERLAEETAKAEEKQANEQNGDENTSDGQQQEGEQQGSEKEQNGEQKDGQQQGEEKTGEQLAEQQQRSAEEARALEEQLRQAQERMNESKTAPREEMDQLREQTERKELPENLEENSEQLQQQQFGPAQQQQQQMQQDFQQVAQKARQMQQQMQQQQQQINAQALRRALDDVLRLSDQQEALRRSVEGSTPDNPALREAARRQTALSENFQTVSDSIQAVAKRLPNVTRAVQRLTAEAQREMTRATERLSERQPPQAAGNQKAAMTDLNELALRLSDVLNQAMNGQQGQGGGQSMQQMMEQLGEMTGGQQKLNEQIQQMLNDMQGDRLSSQGQQRLRQLAEQQAAIRRQLRQMSRNPESRGQLLGDLEKLAEQMEESIQEMQRGRVDRPLIQRQQQILTRMLEAQRSMQQRGQEERREGRQARDTEPTTPEALTPDAAAEQLRRDLIRALESGYAPDYQTLIKRYFELLREQAPR